MVVLEKQLFKALWFGALLFVLIVVGCALSVALMAYYNQYEMGLLFPIIGVFCMLFGEKLLGSMEKAGGQDVGGAGSTLIRSCVAAGVVVMVPTLCWGVVLNVADLMVTGMVAGDLPRNSADFTSYFRA